MDDSPHLGEDALLQEGDVLRMEEDVLHMEGDLVKDLDGLVKDLDGLEKDLDGLVKDLDGLVKDLGSKALDRINLEPLEHLQWLIMTCGPQLKLKPRWVTVGNPLDHKVAE